jgi:hypothetical protein
MVTLLQRRIFIYSIFTFLLITVFIILFARDNQWKLFFYLTLLSFWSMIFYFTSMLLMDIRIAIFKRDSQSFVPFMRNHYFKFAFCFSYLAVIGYWLMAIMGPSFLTLQSDFFGWLLAIFLHGGVQAMAMTDFIIVDHAYIPNYSWDILIFAICYGVYVIIVAISLYGLKNARYQFMTNPTFFQIAVGMLLIFAVLMHIYLFYQFLLRKKMGVIIEEPTLIPKAEEMPEARKITKGSDLSSNITTTIITKGVF